MRLFLALNLPAEERARLYEAAAPLRDAGLPVRWVAPDALHVTLKFLGHVRPEDVGRVEEVMRTTTKQRPFELRLGGFGAFPTMRRPRVIWAGADATPQLRFLKHDIEWGFAQLGFEREDRAYHPHVTLGRAKSGAGAGEFRGLERLFAGLDYEAVLSCVSVELMRSHLTRDGASYEVIASAPLGGGAGVREG
jgi:RNA 2',3'-cyclic 3'-phosphodiesterase